VTLPKAQDSLRINTPEVWQAVRTAEQKEISQGWLKDFQDPRATSLAQEALRHNQDLQSAAAQLRVSRELTLQARAELLPRLRAGGSGGLSDSDASSTRNYGLSLGASWEPDLWGRLRDLNRAVAGDFDAAVAEFRGAQLSLVAATVKSYCNVISAQQQWVLAETTRDSFEKNLRIIERNYKSGVPNVRALDVQLGRSNVSQAQRTEKARELERDDAIRSLEVLLGRYPATAIKPGAELPQVNQRVLTGWPASLIERRPDLQAARARLQASAYRASAAKKSLLPNFSLLGNASVGGPRLSRLLDPAELVSTVTANFTQALYAGGALESEVRAAVERNRALIHDYAQRSLVAFREVESAIAAEESLREQEVFLKKEVEQAALAERQAERDYSEGIDGVDILSVLESQRRANNARSALIRLQNERLQNRVDLYLALGGSAGA
jgi:NodT family efflux transporter outer membrane factor (OMF) lipoprotein